MKDKIKDFLSSHIEGILYLVFGGLTTLISILSFLIFGLIFGKEQYLLSNLLSWLLSVAFAFVTNKLIVFRSHGTDKITLAREILEFFGARLFSLGIEEGGLWIMLDLAKMNEIPMGDMISKIFMSVIVILVNYFISKFIIFKKQ